MVSFDWRNFDITWYWVILVDTLKDMEYRYQPYCHREHVSMLTLAYSTGHCCAYKPHRAASLAVDTPSSQCSNDKMTAMYLCNYYLNTHILYISCGKVVSVSYFSNSIYLYYYQTLTPRRVESNILERWL